MGDVDCSKTIISKDSPYWDLYQEILARGVTDSELQGFETTDYSQASTYVIDSKKRAVCSDEYVQEQEVLEYTLEHYTDYQQALKTLSGLNLPWALDDLDPQTTYDDELRLKIDYVTANFKYSLEEAGYTEGTDDYNILLGLSIYAFIEANDKGEMPAELRQKLIDAKLGLVIEGIEATGGLGVMDIKDNCKLEQSGLESVNNKCGACSEKSAVVYGAFKNAGLDAKFIVGLDKDNVTHTLASYGGHFWVGISDSAGGIIQYYDPHLNTFGDDQHYRKDYLWFHEISEREALALSYGNLCNNLSENGDKPNARKTCEKAISIDPLSYTAVSNTAYLYRDEKDWRNAEKYLLQKVQINPYSLAYRDLAETYVKANDAPNALMAYEKYLSIFPNDPLALMTLGQIQLAYGAEFYKQANQPTGVDVKNLEKSLEFYQKGRNSMEKAAKNGVNLSGLSEIDEIIKTLKRALGK